MTTLAEDITILYETGETTGEAMERLLGILTPLASLSPEQIEMLARRVRDVASMLEHAAPDEVPAYAALASLLEACR